MIAAQDPESLSRQYFIALLLHRNSEAWDLLLAASFRLIEPLRGWKVDRV